MKIVCDKCATKYSIADEKVRNKVFKIRCKKCSHIIVVKGGDGAADSEPMTDNEDGATVAGGYDAAPAPAANGAGGERVWFLVVSGEQVGPFNGAEVRSKFGGGEIDGETYAWREGFGDWLRLATIDEFVDLAGGGGAGGGETRRTDLSDMFGARAAVQEEDAGEDLFGRSQAPTAVASNPTADLFGGSAGNNEATEVPRSRAAAVAPVAAAAAAAAPAAAAAAEPDHKLTGQRNENSVLFSLSNLQALATAGAAKSSAPAPSPAPAPVAASPAPAAKAGFATAKNEGSGLIDIRAMAAATLSSVGTTSGGTDSTPDIPSFSAAPVFTPVVAAPVMLPTQPQGTPKWVWAVVGVGGAAFLGAAGLVAALLLKKPEQPNMIAMAPPAAAANANPAGAAPNVAPAAAAPAVAAPAAAAPAAAVPAAAAPVEAKPEKKDDAKAAAKPKAAAGTGTPKKAADKPAAVAAAPAPAPKPAAAPPEDKPAPAAKKKPGGGGGDDLDDLLNSATGGKKAPAAAAAPKPAAEPAADANLPDQLDRSDVLAGMKAVTPKATACYQQYHVPGIAMVSVVIAKSGKVQSASVGGALAGTPTGDCVAKAVKTASFKQFKGAPMSIQYPFQLR